MNRIDGGKLKIGVGGRHAFPRISSMRLTALHRLFFSRISSMRLTVVHRVVFARISSMRLTGLHRLVFARISSMRLTGLYSHVFAALVVCISPACTGSTEAKSGLLSGEPFDFLFRI